MNAWTGASFNVATDDRPEQVPASRRTPGFFTMEGLPLLLGRDFLPEEGEPGRDHVVILSHRFWSKHFHSNRDLIGKDIRMNGEPYTVVGVLPPGMHDRFNSQVWVPLSFTAEQIAHEPMFMSVMARLKDGVTIDQAQAEMNGIAAQLNHEFPKNSNREMTVEPLHLNFVTPLHASQSLAVAWRSRISSVNWLRQRCEPAVGARHLSSKRNCAVRAALGASRTRLVRSVSHREPRVGGSWWSARRFSGARDHRCDHRS